MNRKIKHSRYYLLLNFSLLIIFLVSLLTMIFTSLHITQTLVYAQTPTKSAQVASSSGSLSDKLKALQAEIASKAAKIKQDVNKNLENKAFIGTIKSISDPTLSLLTKNDTKKVKTDEYTIFVQESAKKITIKNLGEGDYLAALGDIDDTGVLNAKRIVKLTSSTPPAKQIIGGVVQEIKSGSFLLKAFNSQTTYQIQTSSKTNYQFSHDPASFSAIKTTKPILVVGTTIEPKSEISTASAIPNQTTTISARFIYIIPYAPKLPQTSPTSSPSATPKSSPKSSQSPKASESP